MIRRSIALLVVFAGFASTACNGTQGAADVAAADAAADAVQDVSDASSRADDGTCQSDDQCPGGSVCIDGQCEDPGPPECFCACHRAVDMDGCADVCDGLNNSGEPDFCNASPVGAACASCIAMHCPDLDPVTVTCI